MNERVTVESHGPDDTARLARDLAPHLRAGDALLLTGDLAAGKTTFTSALVAALGSDAAVTSPTFSLANFYDTPGLRVLHVDTYRLEDLAEFRDLGLDEYLDEVIAVIEWAGLVSSEFPEPLDLTFAKTGDTARTITLSGAGRWSTVLDDLAVRA
ncbi:tRNA (adenosine(37)-N6)-threonylcarbamoyltransferase complex ATPase subunit type 1 TsaE [Actinomycetospora termitidis]|uniref:tRNA threonylcarbamoyladenosine biosynthesis protein TsaE n=1 Tax=Actinomycetospora termitidis TaxID=3053470 RepID=A0ABT7M8T3_9PSEU|nr:tRNA (adenosine(37)-N6)-threonylcarbamoyltransferase complex ATPase subunit type 1 TsaE [Actinomycetospora sp. Odt1-22]MDL5157090.1 tRNA (adenosine(37)-N6)-threonylcarbamoyltransferase complex ATPase subunit type 1 TsaE [Actinomycetospora sp. Odt1-22]